MVVEFNIYTPGTYFRFQDFIKKFVTLVHSQKLLCVGCPDGYQQMFGGSGDLVPSCCRYYSFDNPATNFKYRDVVIPTCYNITGNYSKLLNHG